MRRKKQSHVRFTPIATEKADIGKLSCLLYSQKQTCAVQTRMSAMGQKRTHAMQQRGSLFDHFVGAGEQRWWDGDAKHLRGFEVDDKFEIGGELNRQMGDKGTFKYLVYVRCGAMKAILKINSIANERPRFHELAVATNGREPSCRCGSGDIMSAWPPKATLNAS